MYCSTRFNKLIRNKFNMIGRTIPHAHSLESRELYALSKKSDVLQDVNMAEMNGVLRQIAHLGSCAADIFTGIMQLTTDIGDRMDKAKVKVDNLRDNIPQVEQMIRSAESTTLFYGNDEQRISHYAQTTESLFTPASRDKTLVANYERCMTNPDFSELDDLRTDDSTLKDGQSCVREYSNPAFVMEQWQLAEERRLALEKAEAAEAKARRKAARKKKRLRSTRNTQPLAALNVKKYNALGAEFGDDGMDSIAATISNNENSVVKKQRRSVRKSGRKSSNVIQEAQQIQGSSVPLPPSSPASSGNALPPPPTRESSASSAPLPSGNASLLSAIRNVDKSALNKTLAPTKGPSILDGIKGFKKNDLRSIGNSPKISAVKSLASITANETAVPTGVAAILSRRLAIQVDEDDDSDYSEWSDDDYEDDGF